MRTRLVDASLPEHATALAWLQAQTLPGDVAADTSIGHWWLTHDDGIPVAYAGMQAAPSWPGTAYVARVGVIAKCRGKGLQRKLLKTLEKKARELGIQRLITTTYQNPFSANNFIRCGYMTYEPQRYWGADGTIYWLKELATE